MLLHAIALFPFSGRTAVSSSASGVKKKRQPRLLAEQADDVHTSHGVFIFFMFMFFRAEIQAGGRRVRGGGALSELFSALCATLRAGFRSDLSSDIQFCVDCCVDL